MYFSEQGNVDDDASFITIFSVSFNIYSLAASCSLQSAVFSLRSSVCGQQSTVCSLQSAVCGLRSAVCGLRSAVCSLQSAVCSLRSAVCGLRSAVYSLQSANIIHGECRDKIACFDIKGRFCLAFKNFPCRIAQKFYYISLRKTPCSFYRWVSYGSKPYTK